MNYIDFLGIIALICCAIWLAASLDRWEAEMDDPFLADLRSDPEILRAIEDERLAVFQDPDEPYDYELDEEEDDQ